MSRRYPQAALAVAMLLTLAAGGCSTDPTKGYTLASMYEANIDSVAVPIFARSRDVYRRDLEFRLTEAVKKRIALDTPYRIRTVSEADTELTGTIELISQRVLSSNPDTGHPRDQEILMVLSFTWKDLRSGRTLRDVQNFRVAADYIPDVSLSEDFFQGSEDLINKAARLIVQQMQRGL